MDVVCIRLGRFVYSGSLGERFAVLVGGLVILLRDRFALRTLRIVYCRRKVALGDVALAIIGSYDSCTMTFVQ